MKGVYNVVAHQRGAYNQIIRGGYYVESNQICRQTANHLTSLHAWRIITFVTRWVTLTRTCHRAHFKLDTSINGMQSNACRSP